MKAHTVCRFCKSFEKPLQSWMIYWPVEICWVRDVKTIKTRRLLNTISNDQRILFSQKIRKLTSSKIVVACLYQGSWDTLEKGIKISWGGAGAHRCEAQSVLFVVSVVVLISCAYKSQACGMERERERERAVTTGKHPSLVVSRRQWSRFVRLILTIFCCEQVAKQPRESEWDSQRFGATVNIHTALILWVI